eukprot:CAMPEP_0118680742 /NCGR_PEP_ID=MMETSP0800-20121206/4542_1 /TAXON_ID=210618 ORGANISM="Striatella unipunctata, Strain CCMP2910" /NCGR_SAMPLE_ID=MMETSP0800 /ASSEMBLY_ACC=CAM_ASM_000638 /LENGTH=96 /DNA_ID=CAMNT_0006576941 /DNA_START=198 /DNA_END=488 /DNA_ORIENTATION=-
MSPALIKPISGDESFTVWITGPLMEVSTTIPNAPGGATQSYNPDLGLLGALHSGTSSIENKPPNALAKSTPLHGEKVVSAVKLKSAALPGFASAVG